MKLVLALSTMAALSACGAAPTSSTESSVPAQQHMWQCSGFNILDTAHTVDRYQATIDRARFDEKANVPVKIVIQNKVDSNTARPSIWKTIVSQESRLITGKDGFQVDFTGGHIIASHGNSGITGTLRQMQGSLVIGKKTIAITCPY